MMPILGNDCTDAEERRLLSVFDALEDGIILLTSSCKIAWVNKWIEARLASQMPLVGKRCEAIFPSMSLRCSEGDDEWHPEQGRLPAQVIAYPSADEPTGWLEITATRLEDADGNRTAGVMHVRDITEHRRSEDLLKDEISRRRILVEQSSD